MPTFSREFHLYAQSIALALALDVAVFRIGLGLGASVAVAAAFGFLTGLVFIYAVSTRFVFRQRRVADARLEFACFAGIGLAGLALTEAQMWLLVQQLQLAPVPAKLTTAVAVFVFNFALRKQLLFTLRQRVAEVA